MLGDLGRVNLSAQLVESLLQRRSDGQLVPAGFPVENTNQFTEAVHLTVERTLIKITQISCIKHFVNILIQF